MKAFSQLMSCLLVASVALLNSGAAWSETQPKQDLAKSTATDALKKAKKHHHKHHHKAKQVANVEVPVSNVRTLAAENPYLSTSTAPIVAKANPYLPGAVVEAAKVPYSHAPMAIPVTPAAPLALAKSLSLPTFTANVPAMPNAPKAVIPEQVVTSHADGAVAPTPVTPPPMPAVVAHVPVIAASPATMPAQVSPWNPVTTAKPTINPYLMNSVAFNQSTATVNPTEGLGQLFRDIKLALPSMPPLADVTILPSIKKVYPTGDKPLYVLTFKCPTELVGFASPPIKALHWLVTSGMDAINYSNLLPFNMQQVCQ